MASAAKQPRQQSLTQAYDQARTKVQDQARAPGSIIDILLLRPAQIFLLQSNLEKSNLPRKKKIVRLKMHIDPPRMPYDLV